MACSGPVVYNGRMDRPASFPQHIWDSFSDEARAIVGAVIDGLERQVAEQRQQVHDLKVRLDQNPSNSSRPPSTDPIGVEAKAARAAVEEAPGRSEGTSSPDESPGAARARRLGHRLQADVVSPLRTHSPR